MKTILFIEDEAGQRELTTRLYQMCRSSFHGEVNFITADSWSAGDRIMESTKVDVVILDLTLPPMGWMETLTAMRANLGWLPPVVILTGHEDIEWLREKCFEYGVDDFMFKKDVNHFPEQLCERVYHCALRRNRPQCPTTN